MAGQSVQPLSHHVRSREILLPRTGSWSKNRTCTRYRRRCGHRLTRYRYMPAALVPLVTQTLHSQVLPQKHLSGYPPHPARRRRVHRYNPGFWAQTVDICVPARPYPGLPSSVVSSLFCRLQATVRSHPFISQKRRKCCIFLHPGTNVMVGTATIYYFTHPAEEEEVGYPCVIETRRIKVTCHKRLYIDPGDVSQ